MTKQNNNQVKDLQINNQEQLELDFLNTCSTQELIEMSSVYNNDILQKQDEIEFLLEEIENLSYLKSLNDRVLSERINQTKLIIKQRLAV